MAELDRSMTVYVTGASGTRSGAMTNALRDVGFDARAVVGATRAWIQSGRPVEKGTAITDE